MQTASKASFELLITFAIIVILLEYRNALNIRKTRNVLNILKSLNNLNPLLSKVSAGSIEIRSMIANSVKGYLINDDTDFLSFYNLQ